MVLKAEVIYQWPWDMTSSFNFQTQSGRVIYSEIRVPPSVTDIPGTTRIVAFPSDGEDRTDLLQTLDFRVEKAFALGGETQVAVFGDVLNVFNSDANESVLDQRIGNENYLVPSRFIAPRRLMIGAKVRF